MSLSRRSPATFLGIPRSCAHAGAPATHPTNVRPLVQGTAAQEIPYTRDINAELPPNFGDGAP